MFVDMHGKPCAKLVPAQAIEGFVAGGAGFAGFAAGPDGPDARRSRHPRHARPGFLLPAAVEAGGGGRPVRPDRQRRMWPFAPRVILKRQLELPRGAGSRAQGRSRSWSTSSFAAPGRRPSRSPTRWMPRRCPATTPAACCACSIISRPCRRISTRSAGPTTQTTTRTPNGQFEQNFAFADALTTADRRDAVPLHGALPGRGMPAWKRRSCRSRSAISPAAVCTPT